MKSIKQIGIIGTILLGLVFSGCSKKELDVKNKDFFGPSLQEQSQPLSIISPLRASQDSVDLAQGPFVYFTAEFNKDINWTIELKGEVTQSVTYLTGRSKTLEAANATWNGLGAVPLYRAKEKINAKLYFNDADDTLKTSFAIKRGRVIFPSGSILVTDFESTLLGPLGKLDPNSQAAETNFSLVKTLTPILPAEGNQFYRMSGTDFNRDYFVGGLIYGAGSRPGGPRYFPLPTDTSGLYFNVMVYGNGTDTTNVGVAFYEDENNDGIYLSTSEDNWSYNIAVNWTGWRLVSFRYAQCANPNYAGANTPGNRGNKLFQPDKVVSVVFSLTAPAQGARLFAGIDYPIFTIGSPLKP
jgi:hypothetical protein